MGKTTKVLMCYVDFDDSAPTGFLIRNTRNAKTVLVQTDYDYPGVASNLGWSGTCCGATDGTVDCKTHQKTATEMIASAYDWIVEHEGDEFEDPGYFEDEEVITDEERSYGPNSVEAKAARLVDEDVDRAADSDPEDVERPGP